MTDTSQPAVEETVAARYGRGPGEDAERLRAKLAAKDQALADRCLELGFYLSFSGIVTFRNADSLRAVARNVPDDRILVETDSPYLAPIPHRGRRNEPARVIEVARLLAEERGTSLDAFETTVESNFRALFPRATGPA